MIVKSAAWATEPTSSIPWWVPYAAPFTALIVTVTVADAIDKVTADSVVFKYTFEMAGRYEIMLVNPSGEASNTVVVRVNW